MNDIKNWKEVTKGLYRYVVASKVCYEIHIIKWVEEQDILEAPANLYLAGYWSDGITHYFEREAVAEVRSVQDCLAIATKDYKEMWE